LVISCLGGLQTLNHNEHFGRKCHNFLTRNGRKANSTGPLPYFWLITTNIDGHSHVNCGALL
jgi:hypothetical protein